MMKITLFQKVWNKNTKRTVRDVPTAPDQARESPHLSALADKKSRSMKIDRCGKPAKTDEQSPLTRKMAGGNLMAETVVHSILIDRIERSIQ